jgi:hypothetical protein
VTEVNLSEAISFTPLDGGGRPALEGPFGVLDRTHLGFTAREEAGFATHDETVGELLDRLIAEDLATSAQFTGVGTGRLARGDAYYGPGGKGAKAHGPLTATKFFAERGLQRSRRSASGEESFHLLDGSIVHARHDLLWWSHGDMAGNVKGSGHGADTLSQHLSMTYGPDAGRLGLRGVNAAGVASEAVKQTVAAGLVGSGEAVASRRRKYRYIDGPADGSAASALARARRYISHGH